RCEHPHAVELAATTDHLQEARIVVRRRDQAGAAGEIPPRALDVIALPERTVRSAEDLAAIVVVTGVDGDEAIALAARQEEHRVFQSERTRDARVDQLVKWRARRLFRDAAKDVGVVAVDPR